MNDNLYYCAMLLGVIKRNAGIGIKNQLQPVNLITDPDAEKIVLDPGFLKHL